MTTASTLPELFTPVRIGAIECPNRVFMAPLTRCRATPGSDAPHELNALYYSQRASAGLIVSEATQVHPQGKGYMRTPGIYSTEQEAGWRHITDAVHRAGGRIVAQLWHVGAISHPDFQPGHQLPVAPSAVNPGGTVYTEAGKRERVTPRALLLEEIAAVVAAFRRGAEVARRAGFDGVEIHGANGYLLDQFLQDSTNRRTDAYGGSLVNRARLMLEVVDACVAVWGAGRVGLHLAPRGDAHTMGDSDPLATFSYVAAEAGRRRIAFLCLREHAGPGRIGPRLRAAFGGPLIANETFTKETATDAIAKGEADAVAWGQLFIANPDLPLRFRLNAPLNPPDPATFYAPGPKGYTDYPAFDSADRVM